MTAVTAPSAARGVLHFLLGFGVHRRREEELGSKGLMAFNSQYAAEACERVFLAEDRADLLEHLEMLAADDELWRRERGERRSLSELTKMLERGPVVPASMEVAAGHAAVAKFRKAMKSMLQAMQIAVAIDKWMKSENSPGLMAPGEAHSEVLVSNLLYDPELTLDARRVLLGVATGCIAAGVLSHAGSRKKRVEPWMALALSEHFENEMERVARGLRQFGNTIALLHEADEAEDRFAATVAGWRECAEASEDGIFIPIQDPCPSSAT